MATPTATDLDILRRMAQTPEGRLLAQVFQSRLDELDRINRRAIGDNLIRGQGRALELEEILTELFGLEQQAPHLQPRPSAPNRPAQVARYRVNHMAVND